MTIKPTHLIALAAVAVVGFLAFRRTSATHGFDDLRNGDTLYDSHGQRFGIYPNTGDSVDTVLNGGYINLANSGQVIAPQYF